MYMRGKTIALRRPSNQDEVTYFHISTLPELLDEDKEDIFPHFHISTLPELLDKLRQ